MTRRTWAEKLGRDGAALAATHEPALLQAREEGVVVTLLVGLNRHEIGDRPISVDDADGASTLDVFQVMRQLLLCICDPYDLDTYTLPRARPTWARQVRRACPLTGIPIV